MPKSSYYKGFGLDNVKCFAEAMLHLENKTNFFCNSSAANKHNKMSNTAEKKNESATDCWLCEKLSPALTLKKRHNENENGNVRVLEEVRDRWHLTGN